MTEMSEHTQRSAVVTGSNRGIGLAVAEELARRGNKVCLNCPRSKDLPETQELASRLGKKYGVQVCALAADVADSAQVNQLIATAFETLGSIDILVNNAGITRDGLLVRMKEEAFDDVIAVNLKGTFNCCKAAAQLMMKRRYGRIVNMSSVAGVFGNAGQVNYASSKAGIIGLTKSLARELAARNITVNAVAPGFISTDMTDKLSKVQREAIAARIAAKRFGKPAEVACLIGYLASEEAGYVNGQVVCIDGGMAL